MPAAEPRLPEVRGEAWRSTGQDQRATTRTVPAMGPRAGFFTSLRVVGQVFDGYLVCEQENGLVLIDQHAAHERVMFENLRAAYSSGSVPSQRLLIPVVVEVGQREAALIGERVEELEALGFEVDSFGGASFNVRAVPALLSDCDPAILLRDVAEELADVGRSRRLAEAAEAVLACLACHSAVRFGQSLTLPQIRALLTAMDSVDFSGHCPHGRPAFIQFPRTELERWFKRT
jgi:DNA mismatch repair protein MutL